MSKESKTYKNMPKKIYIRTFGCQMNDRDSEIIYGLLTEKGWESSESPEEADCVLFNTCSVRHHAEQRAYSNMGALAKLKRRRPDLILGFVGCTAQKDKDEVRKRLPHVDLVTGPGEIYRIPEFLEEIISERRQIIAADVAERPARQNPLYREKKSGAFVSISEGCDNFCSYCIVPYVRGRQRSREKELILKEVDVAQSKGIQEITLLGQNVSSYGWDLKNGYDFVCLLKDVHDIDGIKKIKFMTSHPKDTKEDLFKAMRDLPKVDGRLHLPLQSASARILEAMKRGYTPGHYEGLIKKLRSYIPDCAVTTDIIVGFPGESNKDFEDTLTMIKKIRFDSAYIFKYSPRPPAVSSKLEDDVPESVKKERHARLLELQKQISKEKRLLRRTS